MRSSLPLVTAVLALALHTAACLRPISRPDETARDGRVHALLLNGGGRPALNYQSHLQHVRRLVEILSESGVPAERIVIFSSDGSDPAADLATKERAAAPKLWLLPDGFRRVFHPPLQYVDSSVDGYELRPATRGALRDWFEKEGRGLRRGDTLLFYVTDHGERDDDLANNTITLWNEKLSVTDLGDMLETLDRGVRVVNVMSQCFSGSFANLIFPPDGALPTGDVCGYFSTTAERFAYGCYPENRGKDGVGHSFHLLEALAPLGRMTEAHRRVLVADDAPDVPHTTSDFYLEELLRRDAGDGGEEAFVELVDEWLAAAWQDRSRWEREIRLLDRIGQRFGFASPRSLAELEHRRAALEQLAERLAAYAERWQAALDALRRENLLQFVAARPEWREGLDLTRLSELGEAERQTAAEELMAELVPFAESSGDRMSRLQRLREKARTAARAYYRAEVRLGVLLRMRPILVRIAAFTYLDQAGRAEEKRAVERLTRCEEFAVNERPRVASASELPLPKTYPLIAEEEALVQAVMPAWLGIQYRPLSPAQREHAGAPVGAVLVAAVYPDSPAAEAGLQVGDILIGPPGEPFEETHRVREWTMGREIGTAGILDVLREGETRRTEIRLAAFPVEMPELPGPPQVGSVAPPIEIEMVRGEEALLHDGDRLLFFWATWCAICHIAVPEVLAFGADRDIAIVAVTDEDTETVRRFLAASETEFPQVIGSDALRRTFQRYGVSGTPTFVLVDENGIVQHHQTGYDARRGLGIDGWRWQRSGGH